MTIVSRSAVIPPCESLAQFTKAGVPGNGDFNGQAAKGCTARDTLTGVLYQNVGTKTATVWEAVVLEGDLGS